MSKNPPWTRDELILALDLYFGEGRVQLPSNSQLVQDLSALLNGLQLHTASGRTDTFRNPHGVSLKLGNFLSIDPDYSGSGLSNVSRLDRQVWSEFANDPVLLKETAEQIRNASSLLESARGSDLLITTDYEFDEGGVVTRLHTFRERNRSAVKKKKERVLNRTGALKCEACGFDFKESYGKLGKGFAECHHKVPLSELSEIGTTKTRLSDLSIVCANCHRMLHRSRPALSITKLQDMLKGRDDST